MYIGNELYLHGTEMNAHFLIVNVAGCNYNYQVFLAFLTSVLKSLRTTLIDEWEELFFGINDCFSCLLPFLLDSNNISSSVSVSDTIKLLFLFCTPMNIINKH